MTDILLKNLATQIGQIQKDIYFRLDSLEGLLNKINQRVETISDEFSIVKDRLYKEEMKLDIWDPQKISPQEKLDMMKNFKESSINYYDREAKNTNRLSCMLTNRKGTWERMKVVPIWPLHQIRHMRVLQLGLSPNDLKGPRNSIFVLPLIASAFESMQLCFLWDPVYKQLRVKILDPSINEQTYAVPIKDDPTSTKFSNLEGKFLHHPKERIPILIVLSQHARSAHLYAKEWGWISNEQLEEYLKLKDSLDIDQQATDESTIESYGDEYPKVGEKVLADRQGELCLAYIAAVNANKYQVEFLGFQTGYWCARSYIKPASSRFVKKRVAVESNEINNEINTTDDNAKEEIQEMTQEKIQDNNHEALSNEIATENE